MVWINRRKMWKQAGCFSLFCVTAISLYISVRLYGKVNEGKKISEEMACRLEALQKEVYVANTGLPKGTILTEDKVRYGLIYSEEPIENFITQEQFGMELMLDIKEGTGLKTEMLQAVSEKVRTVFISEAELAEHIQTGDRVDVRIRYHNAEDYTVLSDKILVRSESGNGMILELTEEEILYISSAVSDCAKYKGTKLYVVEYPEYRQIKEGTVNYIANTEILILLKREKEEGEGRIALEQRLGRNMK